MSTMAASEKQIAFIKSLGAERVSPTGEWKWGSDPDYFNNLTKEKASYVISKMKALPRKQQEMLPVEVTASTKPVEGIHTVKTSKGVAFVKVLTAHYGSGRLYTKVWSPSAQKFVRASGWLKKTSEGTLMTKEEAAKFGALYNHCANCGKILSDEESVARGYGPVCASNMGWE